jgi:phosphatidylglycerophosphate synthase
MLDEPLRPLKDRLLEPVARRLGAVSPDALTALSLLTGLAAAWAAADRVYSVGVICWLASRVLDGLDGVAARLHHTQRDLGGYYDQMADFAVYAAVPIGLILGRNDPAVTLAGACLIASFYLNAGSWLYLSALLERRNAGAVARGEETSITMPGGLITGTETILFYIAFFFWPGRLVLLFWVMAGLTLFTALQRVVWARGRL